MYAARNDEKIERRVEWKFFSLFFPQLTSPDHASNFKLEAI